MMPACPNLICSFNRGNIEGTLKGLTLQKFVFDVYILLLYRLGLDRMHRDGSSFMWHQPCQHCKLLYTTSVDNQSNASLLESRE